MIDQILHDRYQIQEQLGKKSGRRTLLAKDLKTENQVIIKLLTFSHEFEWDELKLFEREADTLKNLHHEAIPKYLDYFELNQDNYKGFALVQNYIPAKSLEDYLKERRTFTEEEIKDLAKSLLKILIYLHQRNPPIIHRDIKPSNILLDNRSGHSIGKIYLVDFGSVQTLANQESGTITIVGTYGYMPPEQFGGRTIPASDLYSLGATLIYLATGNNPADLPQKEGKIQFKSLMGLSSSFIYWINKLIEPSLDKRFTSAKGALENLENLHQLQLENTRIIQPSNTKIILETSDDKLEVFFPAEGFNLKVIPKLAFAIAWSSFILIWTATTVSADFSGVRFFVLFSILFWVAGFSMIGGILMTLFGQSILSIEQEKITLQHKCLGFNIPFRRSSRRILINKLERTEMTLKKDSDGDKMTIPPALIIWAGTHEYKINSDLKCYMSVPELEWLASELSEWLGLPISRKN